MYNAKDIAMALLEKSIALANREHEPAYYMNFVKLHKLMYLAKCYSLSKYGETLFHGQITAHRCGPYVEDLKFLSGLYGFGDIPSLKPQNGSVPPHLPLLFLQEQIVDDILRLYGHCSAPEIVEIAKGTYGYRKHQADASARKRPVITEQEMRTSGKELFFLKWKAPQDGQKRYRLTL